MAVFSPHNSSSDNPMAGLSGEQKRSLGEIFAGIIAKSELTIIACVTDVCAAFEYDRVSNQQDLYHFAYKPLSERFQYFLQDNDGLGMIISDHRGQDNDKLFRAHHQTLMDRQRRTSSRYDRFIEGLLLQDSCHSVGVQMADFVAGAIHRAYSTGDNRLASIIKPRIRTKADGNILGHGIVHHPRDKFKMNLRREDQTPGGAVAPTP